MQRKAEGFSNAWRTADNLFFRKAIRLRNFIQFAFLGSGVKDWTFGRNVSQGDIRKFCRCWSKTLWASYCRSTKRQQGSRRTEHADYDILQTGVLRSVSIHTLETRSLSIIGTDGIFCRVCTGFECLFKTDWNTKSCYFYSWLWIEKT